MYAWDQDCSVVDRWIDIWMYGKSRGVLSGMSRGCVCRKSGG